MNKYDPIDPKRLEPTVLHVSKFCRVVPGELPGDLPRVLWSRGQTFRHPPDSFKALWKRAKRSGGTWRQKMYKLFELQFEHAKAA